ncbi:MAG: hypothetical protein V4545_04275 [Pseudomonadota bacterium]
MATKPLSHLIDELIWADGVKRNGGELDYLRALHYRSSLQLLSLFLHVNNPTLKFRLSSIWLDKFPICRPLQNSGCNTDARELGDLGIVIRGQVKGGTYIRFRILQGKIVTPSWEKKGKSPQEIELYQKCPAFDLYTSAHRTAVHLGQFDLNNKSNGFNFLPYKPNVFPFWSFLMFEPASFNSSSSTYSPITLQWDSNSSCIMSYSDSIQAMVLNLSANTYEHGARVDQNTTHTSWRELFWTLWRHSGRSIGKGKLSGGPWRNNVTRFCKTPDIHINSAIKDQFNKGMHDEGFRPPPKDNEPIHSDEDERSGINWIIIDVFGEHD